MSKFGRLPLGTLLLGLQLTDIGWTQAEDSPAVAPSGGPVKVVRPGGGPQPVGPMPGTPNPGQANPNPSGENPAEGDKKEGGAETLKPVTRSDNPPTSGDRGEFHVRPNVDGKVQLNFQGQKWLDVLEWYAEISALSLDWQEIPGDYLNLRTQRSYSVPEIRDILNRHLMDRGYTLLRSGEVLIVANLKKLDPALVPRVMPEDLENLDPHEFVKTSFKLDWLIAEATAEELKPLLSPHGKVWALKATNRIEALDAVANLQALHHVLRDEQSGHGQERLVREFRLEYTRADEVYDLLLGLLGKEKPKKDEGPMDPRRMMQMQQQMMQMQQMQQNQGGAKPAVQKPGEIHVVVNRRENSILVNGPPDQVAVVEQAVRQLDVPPEQTNSLLQNPNRMQIYRLASIDPDPLVETLNEVGNLDPQTQLRVDKKNRSIIAYASLADHVTIKAMIDKLDGTDRKFEVIRLRKLEADYVAGSIQFMMGEAEDKSQQSRRSYYFYDPFSSMSGGSSDENQTRKFRVDADVEHNRLLIWANDIELAEIQNLLVKLGELPPPGSRAATLRTLDSIPLEDAPYLIERLREAWPGLGDNPLQLRIHPRDEEDEPAIPVVPDMLKGSRTSTQADPQLLLPTQPAVFRFSKSSVSRTTSATQTAEVPPEARQNSGAVSSRSASPGASTTIDIVPDGSGLTAVEEKSPLSKSGADLPPGKTRPPIVIELDSSGRWILRSSDTQALDQLEDLLADLAPARRDYKLFQLQHSTSWAFGIAMTLEEFFKDEPDKPEVRRPYWYYDDRSDQKDETKRLSKRRPLKFISDSDSNTILVVGADAHQLRIIEELIEYYDQPVASDATALRRTEIFQIENSSAQVIADALKDVYRDLLSENDKALQAQNNQKQNEQRQSERTVTYVYDSYGDSGSDKKGADPPAPVRFKGALSIGVDEISNSLIISSTENLLKSIRIMVAELDQAAKPKLPTMQVMQVDRNISLDIVQDRLAKLLRERKQPRQPQQPPQQPNGQQIPQQPVIEDDRFP